MKKLFLSIFLLLPILSFGNDWVPLKDNIPTNKVLSALATTNGQISYCIDGTQTQVLPDINKVFQIWFDNVLSYRDVYPDFDKTFSDILPILKRQNKLLLQKCGTPFTYKKVNNFLTQKKGYPFSLKRPVLRISFCTKKECFGSQNIGGSCQIENVPEKNVLIAADGKDVVGTLLHELGHALSFGDIKYYQELNDKSYGYNTAGTYLVNDKYLTCDDADGVVALLYMGLGKEKTFYSFCGQRIFENGKVARWKSMINTFTEEGKKYKVLQDLNRHFDKPLKEQRQVFNEKKLSLTLQENIKDSKDLNNLL